MRIISFNILFGAYKPRGRFESIAEFLKSYDPDVVLLQECMDWTPDRLQELGKLVGLDHSYLGTSNRRGSGRRYHLGALSRYSIEGPVEYGAAYLAHGCTEVTIQGVTLFNLHLNAHFEDQRLWEVEGLLEDAFPAERVETEDLVLTGDLNSLSRHDPYPENLGRVLSEAGVTKYGDPVTFDVMDALEKTGWLDPMIGREPWATRLRMETSPPTPTRTDYLLVSPSLKESVADCRVLPLTKDESDHYPVLLELAL